MPAISARLTLLALVLITSPVLTRAENLDMCEIKSLKPVVGKRVTLEDARLAFGVHGARIGADHCSNDGSGAALFFPDDPGVPRVGFDLDSKVHQIIGQGSVPLLVNEVCGTVDGEFFMIKRLQHGPYRSYLLQNKVEFGFVLHSILKTRDCLRVPEPILP